MTDDLEAAGLALFGEMWKAQMGRLLGVNPQFMQRAMMVPPRAVITLEHRKTILKALRDRAKVAERVANKLDKAIEREEMFT